MTSFPQPDAGPSREQPSPGLRASDADRETAVKALHDAFTLGLLTMEECDERMAAAYAARYVRDLRPLTADLPAAPPAAPGWHALFALAWLQLRTALAGFSWRDSGRSVRARPRLALAAVALLVLLSVAAVSTGPLVGGGPDHGGPRIERFQHFGPR